MFKLRLLLKVIGISFLIIFVFLIWKYFIRFLPIFPHQKITISLPFSKENDDLIFINPMGEKVEHANSPNGHPGLDFGWHHPAPLISVASGKVTSIKEHPPGGHGETEKIYDVEIVTGAYAVRYEEIAPLENLRVGMYLNKGDIIGRGGKYEQPGGLGTYYSTHWEFDYDTFWIDRLCPLAYFDTNSQARIDAIWSKVGQTYNGRYPDICSGEYKGKDK